MSKRQRNPITALALTGYISVSAAFAQVSLPTPSSIQEKPSEAHIRIQPEDLGSSIREKILKTDLKMPGMGLQASTKVFETRLTYALNNDWMEKGDREEFDAELKKIVDSEKALGTATDSKTVRERHKLSSKLYLLNQKFEELVLGPSLSVRASVVKPGQSDESK